MCRFLKSVICISFILFMLFTTIAIWGGGGDKFRWLGEKTGGVVEDGFKRLGKQADDLRDYAKEKIARWSGKKREYQDR